MERARSELWQIGSGAPHGGVYRIHDRGDKHQQ